MLYDSRVRVDIWKLFSRRLSLIFNISPIPLRSNPIPSPFPIIPNQATQPPTYPLPINPLCPISNHPPPTNPTPHLSGPHLPNPHHHNPSHPPSSPRLLRFTADEPKPPSQKPSSYSDRRRRKATSPPSPPTSLRPIGLPVLHRVPSSY